MVLPPPLTLCLFLSILYHPSAATTRAFNTCEKKGFIKKHVDPFDQSVSYTMGATTPAVVMKKKKQQQQQVDDDATTTTTTA